MSDDPAVALPARDHSFKCACPGGTLCAVCGEDHRSEAAVALLTSLLPCPEVWQEVAAERERAHAKHRETSMEQQPVDALLRLSILMEEVGEVARCFNEARHRGGFDSGDLTAMRQELIQVAAMAGAWAAALTPYAQGEPE